jgi:hypothetical protein
MLKKTFLLRQQLSSKQADSRKPGRAKLPFRSRQVRIIAAGANGKGVAAHDVPFGSIGTSDAEGCVQALMRQGAGAPSGQQSS